MKIVAYNRIALRQLVESDFFAGLDKIPISRHRAESHIQNPYCSDDDVLLWAAYQEDVLIGYVGALPDLIRLNNIENKIYWLSCFWVNEVYRDKNIASLLFFPLVKLYRKQLFISNFLFSLEKTYQSLGVFQATQNKPGCVFHRNLCLGEKLKARFSFFKYLLPIYCLVEKGFNLVLSVRRLFVASMDKEDDIVESAVFDDEFRTFLTEFSSKHDDVIVQDAGHFEWIFTFPWILPGKPDEESRRYYFSSKSEHFTYHSLKLYESQKMVGYALAKIRDNHLVVSYLYAEDRDVEKFGKYILELARIKNLDTITSCEPRLCGVLRKYKRHFIFVKNTRRPYIFSNTIQIASTVFQDGDGDSVFT